MFTALAFIFSALISGAVVLAIYALYEASLKGEVKITAEMYAGAVLLSIIPGIKTVVMLLLVIGIVVNTANRLHKSSFDFKLKF